MAGEQVIDVLDVLSVEVWSVLADVEAPVPGQQHHCNGFGQREVALAGQRAFQQVTGDAVEEVARLVLLE